MRAALRPHGGILDSAPAIGCGVLAALPFNHAGVVAAGFSAGTPAMMALYCVAASSAVAPNSAAAEPAGVAAAMAIGYDARTTTCPYFRSHIT